MIVFLDPDWKVVAFADGANAMPAYARSFHVSWTDDPTFGVGLTHEEVVEKTNATKLSFYHYRDDVWTVNDNAAEALRSGDRRKLRDVATALAFPGFRTVDRGEPELNECKAFVEREGEYLRIGKEKFPLRMFDQHIGFRIVEFVRYAEKRYHK